MVKPSLDTAGPRSMYVTECAAYMLLRICTCALCCSVTGADLHVTELTCARQGERSDQHVGHSWSTKCSQLLVRECHFLQVKVILRPTVSRPVCLETKHPFEAYDQILIIVWQLRVCRLQLLLALDSAVIFGYESRKTRGHILLSQFRDFPFRRLLRLAGSRWRYSTPPFISVNDILSKNEKRKEKRGWQTQLCRTVYYDAELKFQTISGQYEKVTGMVPTDFEFLINLIGQKIAENDTTHNCCSVIMWRTRAETHTHLL
jgi:hypothetical protein